METSNRETVNRYYDPWMTEGRWCDIDKIGFFNYGYWKGIEDSLEVAQIALIETLSGFFTRKGGAVLDVACGKGASSKFLTKYFDPSKVTGINISEGQLQICRLVAPECTFKLMNATNLEFSDSTFDNILCIEAAFHFLTRRDFLAEAYRVLTAGGKLAMSDVIVHDLDLLPLDIRNRALSTLPRENCLPSLDAYRKDLLDVGFRHVRVEDSTELSVIALSQFRLRKLENAFDRNPDLERLKDLSNPHSYWRRGWTWCMVYAIK